METTFPCGIDNVPHSHFPIFFGVWTGTLLVSRPHLSAFRLLHQQGISANFTKMRKQQCSASVLPSATEWLESRCCWRRSFLQWDSSTLQAVWWESRLLCGSSASRTQHCQERRNGGIFTHYSSFCLAAISVPYAFDLIQILADAGDCEALPAWVAKQSFCASCFAHFFDFLPLNSKL